MMSDYFAALMRASNLFADSAAPALEAPLEFGMEVPVPSVPTEPAPSTAIRETRGAVAARELPAPTAPGPQPAPASLHHDDSSPATSVRRGNIPQWQQAEPRAPRSEQQAPLPGIDPQHSQPRPPQADELVRAAMRWVASDPQLAAPVLQSPVQQSPVQQSPVQQSPVRRAAQPDIADTGNTRLAAVQPGTIAPVDRPGLEDAPGAVRAQVQVPMPVPAPETVPPQVAAPATLRTEPEAPVAAAQEPLAISIGAIHLRVEAPAAQTVARPATPPAPAQRPAAPASPTRSGLSRRALRRL